MMRAQPLLVAALVVAAAVEAAANGGDVEPEAVLIVGRATRGGPWTDAPTEARPEDGAELAVVVKAREGRRRRLVYAADADVAPLVLDGRAIGEERRREWSVFGAVSVRWSYVEPYAWRPADQPAVNGATTPYYSNVVSGGDHHGDWLGWDVIPYFATAIGDWSSDAAARRRPATANPPRAEDDVFGGLGTMRYQVEVRFDDLDGATLASPGIDAVDTYGIEASVHRVSIRRDDTYLGWLTSYFLVPEVFGSAGPGENHQTERYVGVDCADVLIGALHAQGHEEVPYGSVSALDRHATPVAGPAELDEDGKAVDADITGVLPGDIIRIDYTGAWAGSTPRTWDHVAVFYEDRSDPEGPLEGRADGRLDGFDLVVHLGHPRLTIEPLGRQCPMRIDVLRWDLG